MWVARLSGWLFWFVATSWLLVLSLWLALHLFIVPRIDDFRPWLQAQASKALGMRLELGTITAQSRGWVPEFEVGDIRILNQAGEIQLSLGHVTLALTPTSALQGAFSQITLDHLSLDITRDAQGELHVAGIAMPQGGDGALRDWVFSQWEWVLRHGELSYLDETQGKQPTLFTDVQGVLRNGLRDHRFRLDATPSAELGQRFSLRGRFKQPLLSTQSGSWENWSGLLYAQSNGLDLQALQQRFMPTTSMRLQGTGWARAWMQFKAGQVQSWATDFGLKGLQVDSDLSGSAWHLPRFKRALARLEWSEGKAERWSLDNAQLEPEQGPAWPMRNAAIELQRSAQGDIIGGLVKIDALDLAQLQHAMAEAPEAWVTNWKQAAPQGMVKQLQLGWSGSVRKAHIQDWKAQLEKVSWQAGATSKAQPLAPWPGVSELNAELSGSDHELRGKLLVQGGHLNWPGLWEESRQIVDQFQADVSLQHDAAQWRVMFNRAQLISERSSLDFDLDWRNSPQDPLGSLELKASAAQVGAQQIARWLPISVPASARQYVKAAVTQGQVKALQAKVSGRMAEFPFNSPSKGEFHVSGQLSDVRFVTVPRSLMPADSTAEWPVFQGLSGDMAFDRASVKLSKVKARLAQAPNVAWSVLEADIKNLAQGVVAVQAEGKGPLNEVLNFWKKSPLNDWTERSLDAARAQGSAEYRLNLSIPIDKTENTLASGSIQFGGNEVSMARGAPTLNRLKGSLRFTANGFELAGVTASAWGGEVKIEGAAKPTNSPLQPLVQVRAQGQLSANGLRDAPELADWAAQLKNLQGSTSYTAQLQWRRGQLETQVSSSLMGMTIQAPDGLGKKASEPMPLRLDIGLTPESLSGNRVLQDQLVLRWGPLLEARYLRDLSGRQPKVIKGVIRWGTKANASMPEQGVVLRVNTDSLRVDEWSDWMQPFTATSTAAASQGAWDLAPQRVELQAPLVVAQGRRLNQVQLDARKTGDTWIGKIQSLEMEGELRYLPGKGNDGGQVSARLSRLTVPASSSSDVDRLLDQGTPNYPALDVWVQSLDLHGKKLGMLELVAQSTSRADGSKDWRISKLALRNEDAEFNAQGRWQKPMANTPSQTQFDFKLNIKNAGQLMRRMGIPDAVRNGAGTIEGRIGWNGSPVTPDTLSMSGRFNVDVERGQFLKTEPGAARLLGVLSLQALPRRLMLDFRDVFSEGFAFDFFRGDVTIERGVAKSDNLQMKGVNAVVMMEGQADIGNETQQLKVLVIPDLNAGGASLVYSAINPVVGLTTFLAQYVLRKPLMESSTQQFEVDGTWSDPKITRVPFKGDAKP